MPRCPLAPPPPLPLLALVLLTLALAGCQLDRSGLGDKGPGQDAEAMRQDASAMRDANARDAAPSDARTKPDARALPDAVPFPDADASPDADTGTDAGPAAPFCNKADPALVACYQFEDSLADGSAYGNHLMGAAVDFGAGRVGRALVTGGASSLFALDSGSLDVTTLTLEAWVRPDSLPTAGRMAVLDKDGAYGLFIHPGGEVRCAAQAVASAVGVVPAGVWTHVACTYDGAQVVIYVNGGAVTSLPASGALPVTVQGLYVAENGVAGNDQLLGAIDEVRVFDGARTPAQIAVAATR